MFLLIIPVGLAILISGSILYTKTHDKQLVSFYVFGMLAIAIFALGAVMISIIGAD
jgi:predicted permease